MSDTILKILRWPAVVGFTAASWNYWQKGDLEVALGFIGILIAIIPFMFQLRTSGEKRESWFKKIFTNRDFKKEYFTMLRYQNRDFDIKGMSTHTEHTLELDQVFVELKLQTQVAHKTTSDPLHKFSSKLHGDSYPVWQFFSLLSENESKPNPKLVIVGPPGSGKTTLLRHMVLLLTSKSTNMDLRKYKIKKIPILFYLRDHVKDIIDNPAILLPELAEINITKWDLLLLPGWFSKNLKNGECLVLLDGLDEVAEPSVRRSIVLWLDKQIHTYPKNAFVITSRPHGYRENPITGVSVLEVMPFNRPQIDSFIQKWYLATEVKSHLKDDPGVRMAAKSGADDLIQRLEKTPTLMELAVNPLLLTMIATVHRFRSALPGRRVELYKEISEVFLGKRQESKGIILDLVPAQKQSVLQSLAYEMMSENMREVTKTEAAEIIKPSLAMVAPTLSPDVFLKSVEQQSGLVLERELGIYSFAHKTFQEYLASMYILDNKLESNLYEHITEDWWHEVIKLYSAQTDATTIIRTCLNQDPPSAKALSLAIQCLEEARQVQPELRDIAEKILLEFAEDADLDIRKIIGEALLSNRIKHLFALSPSIYVDTKLLTNAEYQVFVDEMLWRDNGDFYLLHWTDITFPSGTAHMPATGLTSDDALAFCEWLTELHAGSGEWYFRLPYQDEIKLERYAKLPGFWMQEKPETKISDKPIKVSLWKNPKVSWPSVPEKFVRQNVLEEIKSTISTLRIEGKSKNELEDNAFIKLSDSLKGLLKSSPNADKLLVESADSLYKKICTPSYSRPVDFGNMSANLDTYDQNVSDLIERFANSDFESCIFNGLNCYSNLLNKNPRDTKRTKHLFLAYAFELIDKWIENNKPILLKSRTDSIRRKIEYLVDQYMDGLIIHARRMKVTEPFEGLLLVKEVKDRK